MPEPEFDPVVYIDTAGALLGLTIDPAWRVGVASQFLSYRGLYRTIVADCDEAMGWFIAVYEPPAVYRPRP